MQGAWNSGTVSIPNVTGNIVITVQTIEVTVSLLNAVYTQSGKVYDTDSLDSLKEDLIVTATWSDSSTSIVDAEDYTLSGSLSVGTSTITVLYGGTTTTFTVTVSTIGYDDLVDTTIPTEGQHVLTASDFRTTTNVNSGGVTYKVLYEYTGAYTNVVVPEYMDGVKTLTTVDTNSTLASSTFAKNTTIEYVTFEDGCSVGHTGNATLKNVSGSFSGCTSLIGVSNLPVEITSLNNFFKGCTAFKFADNLEELVNVTTMSGAFNESGVEYVQDLSDFTLLTNVTNLFYACPNFIRIFGLPELNTTTASASGMYQGCPSLEWGIIPKGINNLSFAAYNINPNAKRIDIYADDIPTSGISSASTFYGCRNLKVYCNPNTTTEASLRSVYGSSTSITILNFGDDE